MLHNTNDILDFSIHATDGLIGQVKDFYFDDATWVIRYFVVDTGGWLETDKVLISPIALGRPDWVAKALPVSLTREQVRNSPDIDTEQPVSRQQEILYLEYYGFPTYWGGLGLWGGGPFPNLLTSSNAGLDSNWDIAESQEEKNDALAEAARHRDDDPNLRSCKSVTNYHILATDGDIGHLEGLLVDARTWAIRYLVIDTSNWWLGHKVIVAPQSVDSVSWADATVYVKLTRQAVKDAPPYEPSKARG
jgi:hypothetical protein